MAQPTLELEYKGTTLDQTFKPDFICYGKIIGETKAVERIADANRAQTLNYLNATEFDLALLVNFGHFPKLEYERQANDRNRRVRKSIYSRIAEEHDFDS